MPRQTQLSVGPLIAAVGALLLIVSLFLDWYETYTAFTVFEFLDLLLVLLALVMIFSLAGSMGFARPAVPPGLSLGVAIFTVFVVLSQILNDPPAVVGPGPDKDIGIWLGLSGAALMVAGAVLGYAHISVALETRPRGPAEAPARPDPEAGRPAARGDDDPTQPLSDPAAPPRRPEDRPRP